jgi:ABC-type branched-subunit amino acid transport system permease subunit
MNIFLNPKYRPLWITAAALVLTPVFLLNIGLTYDVATVVVLLALAAMGLNLLVGYTGLVSFGHSAWFGIGGYAAALSHLHWFPNQMWMPLLFAVVFSAVLSLGVGFLILRRKGVYFSLLTFALCALTFAIAFRWTAVTGGEGGLGGIERGTLGAIDLDSHFNFYAVVAIIAFVVVAILWRVVRSPFGHVLMAIRENEQRAIFQAAHCSRTSADLNGIREFDGRVRKNGRWCISVLRLVRVPVRTCRCSWPLLRDAQ